MLEAGPILELSSSPPDCRYRPCALLAARAKKVRSFRHEEASAGAMKPLSRASKAQIIEGETMPQTLPATMTAMAIPKPGGPEALVAETRPVADARPRRDPHPRGGGGRQPPGCAATARPLSASARRFRPAGPRGRRRGRRRSAKARLVSASATRSARSLRAAVTRNSARCTRRMRCRSRRASRWSRPPRSRKPSSPSGPMCSTAAACKRARASWCMAEAPASAPRRSCWPRPSARASSRRRARPRNAKAAASSAPISPSTTTSKISSRP